MDDNRYWSINGGLYATPTRLLTWSRALWNDVMVNEGIYMETPIIMGSIEISWTTPYSSKIKM